MEYDNRTTYRTIDEKETAFSQLCSELSTNRTEKYREMRDEFMEQALNRDNVSDEVKNDIREVLEDEA